MSASPCVRRDLRVTPAFLLLWAVYVLGIFSILRANRLYLDDIGRALYGYADWATAARPVGELLSWLFYFGPSIVDASPFTQVLAAAFLAAASLTLCRILRIRLSLFALMGTLPLGLSPYGLENLSYKFDAPFMALAILLNMLPFLLFRKKGKGFFWSAVLCLFCSASIYQASLGVYLAISGYYLLRDLVSRKHTPLLMRTLFRLALPCLLAATAYMAQMSLWFNAAGQYGDYVSLHCRIPPFALLPAAIADTVEQYLTMLRTDWGGNGPGILLLVLACWFIGSLLLRWKRNTAGARGNALLRLPLLMAVLACFFLTPVGAQLILEAPVWSPRTFCGFGVVMALMLLFLHQTAGSGAVAPRASWMRRSGAGRLAFRVILALLALQLMIFAQVYGNLLAAQGQWERTRIAQLSLGLARFITETDATKITFNGSIGQTPLMLAPARQYPLLERMVSVPLTLSWRWGYEQLKLYGIYIFPGRPVKEGETLSLYMETPSFRIEQAEDGIGVVTFKDF